MMQRGFIPVYPFSFLTISLPNSEEGREEEESDIDETETRQTENSRQTSI